jgi:hypothetical protein
MKLMYGWEGVSVHVLCVSVDFGFEWGTSTAR